MEIVRAPRPQSNWTSFDNAVLRDVNLSMKALGLLTRLLSYPNGWRTDYRTLAQQYRKDGETAFRSAFKELRDEGYLEQTRQRGEDGRWSTTSTIYDQPKSTRESSQVNACGDFPRGKTHGGEPPLIRSTETKNLEEVDELHRPAADASGAAEIPTIPERDTDSSKAAFDDWRPGDLERFVEIIGTTHIRSDGTGGWDEGEWPTVVWYEAFRTRKRKGRKKPMNWPGQYFEVLEDGGTVSEYLAALGLEPVEDEAETDPWATTKSA